jgi:hypothetical protein
LSSKKQERPVTEGGGVELGALWNRALSTLARAARRIAAEPPGVGWLSGETVFLIVAVLAQWGAVALLAFSVERNGWLYYQGGDQTFFYTIAWIVSHGHLPVTGIGYAWSLVEAPVAAVAGPSFLNALPGIIAIQVVLLLPLGLVAFYGTAKRLLGPAMARLGVIAWVAAPYAVIPLFVTRYHTRWIDQTLPQLLGLSGVGDFASMVVVLCAAYLLFRYLDDGGWESAALAGLVAGFAIGLKPSTSLFLAGPAVALAIARRYRGAAAFAIGVAPAVLTLIVWKYRGLGTLPIFSSSYGATELAAGAQSGFDHVAVIGIYKYVHLDWHHLNQNLDSIREYFWSNRLVEWIPIAGAVGAFRRSGPKAAFLAAWLAAFVVVKGTASTASVDTASFWRLLAPAWPAYLLLGLSLVALIPTVGGRGPVAPTAPVPHGFRRTLGVAAIVLGLLPLGVAAALPRDSVNRAFRDDARNLYSPIDPSFRVDARATGTTVTLSWRGPASASVKPTYLILRLPSTGSPQDGWGCNQAPVPRCAIHMTELGYHPPPFVDRPGPGHWVYRVVQAGSYTGAADEGDPLVYSRPVTVTVGSP